MLDLFHNLRVRVVVKDIYMVDYYHRELEERLKHDSTIAGHVSVPHVFIGGQHVGVYTCIDTDLFNNIWGQLNFHLLSVAE